MLLVNPACTDACPITIPPTIPSVCPTFIGNLAPASLNKSIASSKKSASIKGGNGTCALDKIKVSSKSLGISS